MKLTHVPCFGETVRSGSWAHVGTDRRRRPDSAEADLESLLCTTSPTPRRVSAISYDPDLAPPFDSDSSFDLDQVLSSMQFYEIDSL
ncbi:hypothetical protein EVAR_525_1 [Eumeta japonica]|uniref:Uncharacterized protein n=1 Tax=Eumeta variegata TaxID=151549 RepID=A0A4C1SDR5_EUMVA|nr:hypothetical protein EVAR_525_1 [Eumeta japonica]